MTWLWKEFKKRAAIDPELEKQPLLPLLDQIYKEVKGEKEMPENEKQQHFIIIFQNKEIYRANNKKTCKEIILQLFQREEIVKGADLEVYEVQKQYNWQHFFAAEGGADYEK